MRVRIFTDGSARPHTTKVGGWGFLCVLECGDCDLEFWGSGGAKNITNNRMELMAIIKALEFVWKSSLLGSDITIYSDSQYAIKGCNEWLANWKKTNYNDGAVKNCDLWERLYRLKKRVGAEFKWLRGHAGHEMNERVDKIAVAAADRISKKVKSD